MSARLCRDPANALLLWYLNGTLEGEEEEAVRAHLDACETCSRELSELAEVTAAIRTHGAGPLPVARPRLPYALAAALLLPALLGFYWASLGFPRRPPAASEPVPEAAGPPTEAGEPRAGILLDLESGPMRDASPTRALLLPQGVEWAALRFYAPTFGDSPLDLELVSPAGETIARAAGLRGLDPQGRYTYSVAAGKLSSAGDYSLVVHERGSGRSYRFPFRIERTPPSATP